MRSKSFSRAVSGIAACAAAVFVSLTSSGCQNVYYDTMEKFGVHKRDMLVERVEEARDSQEDAKEQFADALEEFLSVTKYTGGNLQSKYEKLSDELDRSERNAKEVTARINSIESVAGSLFGEWETELEQYTNQSLRASSEKQYDATLQRYERLMVVMRKAEARMDPVLAAFRDQVLFLKHNLNARALASLEATSIELQEDINELIAQMEGSIDEASAFIDAMRGDALG